MTALDRQFVKIRFAALVIPVGLLVWLNSASVPVTILLAGLLAAYNGVATLATPLGACWLMNPNM